MKKIVEKQHLDIEQKTKTITALEEEMDCLLQQRTDNSVALERIKVMPIMILWST